MTMDLKGEIIRRQKEDPFLVKEIHRIDKGRQYMFELRKENSLWFPKPVGLTTSLFSWGKVSFVLCAGSTLPTSHSLSNSFLAPWLRNDKSNTFRSDSLLLLVR